MMFPSSRLLVLSIGSDPMLLKVRKTMLEELGCAVVSAHAAAEGVEQFLQGDFDCVFLSPTLPAKHIVGIAAILAEQRPLTPVLLIRHAQGAEPCAAQHELLELLNGISQYAAKQHSA